MQLANEANLWSQCAVSKSTLTGVIKDWPARPQHNSGAVHRSQQTNPTADVKVLNALPNAECVKP